MKMMSPFDREHVGEILRGHGSWFGAKLLRLISEADRETRIRMHKAFPEEVEMVYKYQTNKDWKNK